MDEKMNPQSNAAMDNAILLLKMGPGVLVPHEYSGVKHEIAGYHESAWIGTTLLMSPIYDVVGPDAVKFFNSICVNDFTNLTTKGLRHAVICNDKGQILTDGVVIRLSEDRYRTYWLNPPIDFLLKKSGLNVTGEDKSGTEYFIQVAGERSLEILEDAFEADLHDIKFATHRKAVMDGKQVEVVRLGMSGNLAYEIHGPMADFNYVYNKVWECGKKVDARQLGLHAYNLFNHTEAGFPNIHIHYPLPWMESGADMAKHMMEIPQYSFYNLGRKLCGSIGDDLETRFVTPYDVGWGFLVKFNHDFTGRKALEEMSGKPARTAVTLEWNADDVAAVFATQFRPGEEPCESIASESDFPIVENLYTGQVVYRADRVLGDGKDIGMSMGRIVSYRYNSMISLGIIDPALCKGGNRGDVDLGHTGNQTDERSR